MIKESAGLYYTIFVTFVYKSNLFKRKWFPYICNWLKATDLDLALRKLYAIPPFIAESLAVCFWGLFQGGHLRRYNFPAI